MKKYKFTISGKPYEVEVHSIEGNIAQVNVNGTQYTVEMENEKQEVPVVKPVARPAQPQNETAKPAAQPAPAAAKASGAGHKMEAPLPGTIMQIFVKQGDTVNKGDKLLMYEAMKMENNLLSETSGTVAAINCHQGDNVLQGDVLIVIE